MNEQRQDSARDRDGRKAGHGDEDAGGLTGLRVMVVDDDERVGYIAGRLLFTLGCVPFVFHRPEDAVGDLLRRTGVVDVVLSDVDMPGMTGWQLLQAVRANLGPHPPIILTSGRPLDPPAHCGERPSAMLPKPYGPHELREALREARRGIEGSTTRRPVGPHRNLPEGRRVLMHRATERQRGRDLGGVVSTTLIPWLDRRA